MSERKPKELILLQQIQDGLVEAAQETQELAESMADRALKASGPNLLAIMDGISAASKACVELASSITFSEIEDAIDRILTGNPDERSAQ